MQQKRDHDIDFNRSTMPAGENTEDDRAEHRREDLEFADDEPDADDDDKDEFEDESEVADSEDELESD